MGVVAASAGEKVVLVDPQSGAFKEFRTGPVAWLFPAPGGILFAPDLVAGSTTVINVRTQMVQDEMDGITMPHFGDLSDRYLAVSRSMLVMSYPERAVVKRLEAEFRYPWQVEIVGGTTIAFVLDRHPTEPGEVWMTAVKLDEGRTVYRQALAGDVRHFALSEKLGVVALADAENRQVLLVQPATLTPIAGFKVDGRPMDLVFADDGTMLVVVVDGESGGDKIKFWKIKADKKEGLHLAKTWAAALAGRPQRVAVSPDGQHVAVGSEAEMLEVFSVDKHTLVTAVELPDVPRDVVWCDPSVEGPSLPEWSDEKPPEMEFGSGK